MATWSHSSTSRNNNALRGSAGVLHVVHSLGTGGTERLVIDICTRLQTFFRMAVCCLDDAGTRAHELTERKIPVVALGRRPGFQPMLGYRIANVAAHHAVTIIHCHHYSPFVYGRIATLFGSQLKLVFTEHGRLSDDPPSLKRRLVNPLLSRLPGSLHSVSHALRDSMVAEGFSGRRIHVIPNGIDVGPRPTQAERQAVRRELGIGPAAIVIGSVARLDPVKDLETLLNAFAELRTSCRNAIVVIIGDGAERGRLEAAAHRLGVGDGVRFLGARDDIRRLLPAFDVYVNSSISEGISLTILEAMAAELPLVATQVGGTPEIVTDGLTGLLVPPRRPAALTAALRALCTDPARRERLAATAREHLEQRFTLDRMIGQYARIYDGLAES